MVKVKTSQIPEEEPIKRIQSMLREENEEEKKFYYRTLIHFADIGKALNASAIQSIDKTFRVHTPDDSYFDEDARTTFEYGIIINRDVPSNSNNISNVEIWYMDERWRDDRYKLLMEILDTAGIKVITI